MTIDHLKHILEGKSGPKVAFPFCEGFKDPVEAEVEHHASSQYCGVDSECD